MTAVTNDSGARARTRIEQRAAAPGQILLSWIVLFCVAGSVAVLEACGGGSPAATPDTPDFQISATALSPAPVTAGSPATSTVTITAVGGFSGTVALACSGLPSGTSCSFNPASVVGSGTAQLTVGTSAATPPGSYPLSVQGSSGSTNHSTQLTLAVQSKILHVVIIFQENRSPDNLFQDPNLISAGADIQSYGINSHGDVIPLTPLTLASDYNPFHNHGSFLAMYDNGKMDGADKIKILCNKGAKNCPPPNPQFVYVPASEAAPYFQMAETYTFGDRMFQTNQGPSFPAHQYILSASSAQNANSNSLYAENNPGGVENAGGLAGCIAPQGETVDLIDLITGDTSQTYPCFDHPTLTDSLDTANISWKWYTSKNDPGSIWNAPTAIQHMCVPDSGNTACTGSEWNSNVVQNPAQIITDIQNGQLASVSWVIPDGVNSDHGGTTGTTGPSWVASVVNAVGNSSQYWGNTAIFITWDDWGGWYDHVVPPAIHNQYEYGFRVPLIVISPYAKAKYISHVSHHFGSILKFIEDNWGLAPIGSGTYSDAYSDTDDLSDCFDYNQTPLTFTTIQAPQNQRFFLHDHRPAVALDDD